MDQLEKDVWAVIHDMEAACSKNGLEDLTREELYNLLTTIYDRLGAIVM